MPSLLNRSTVVTDDECKRIASVCDQALAEFCRDWELAPWRVTFNQKAWISIVIVDEDKDVPQALAYHDLLSTGHPVGITMAKTILDAGMGLDGVCSATDHESKEIRYDPYCDILWTGPDGKNRWGEVADAVQAWSYKIDGLDVSDYCLKSWHNPKIGGPYDKLRLLDRPFQVGEGGYQVLSTQGPETQVNGERPPWRGWRAFSRAA